MGISTNNLFLLKAFYLGFRIRESSELVDKALSMVEKAIKHYTSMHYLSNTDKSRLLFYYFVKCEILRREASIGELRSNIKTYAQNIEAVEVFNDYMKVVDSTLVRNKLNDIVEQPRVNTDISLNKNISIIEDYQDFGPSTEGPFRALQIRRGDLTKKQNHFLNDASLKDIM